MDKRNLVGYARVSSKRQSLDIQIEQLKGYAAEKGLDIEIFSESVSAKNICKQRELAKAISRAKELDAPIVVTYLDRVSRNVESGMKIWNEIKIISLFDRVTTSTEAESLFKRAEEDNRYRSEKTKNALEQVKKKYALERHEFYQTIFETEGAPEYVAHYVMGEYRGKTLKSPMELLPCILAAWDVSNISPLFASIDEATEVAELALSYAECSKTRKMLSKEYK